MSGTSSTPRAVVVTVYDPTGKPEQIPAFASTTPGLAYHRAIKNDGWSVTHERSGMILAGFNHAAEAERFAAHLANLADWTLSGDALRQTEGVVYAINEARSVAGSYDMTTAGQSDEARAERMKA